MPATAPSAFRVFVACLLLACVLSVSTSIACGHEHSDHASSHCCTVCHLGHVAWVQGSVTAAILLPTSREWRQRSEESRPAVESGVAVESSRAPPVQA